MHAKQIKIPALDWQTALAYVLFLSILPLLYVQLTGDFPGQVLFYGQEEDSALTVYALNAHAAIVSILATALDTVFNAWAGIRTFFA